MKEMEAKVQRNDSLSRSSFEKLKNWELHYFTFIAVNYSRTGSSKKIIGFGQRKRFSVHVPMDTIRNKLKRVTKETVWMKKIEVNPDLTIQNLNSKLLRAKSKLEAVSAAKEKAKSI